MQGERSLVSTMAENVSIDHASMSGDVVMDPQLSWHNLQTSAQNREPDYRLSSSETNNQYLPCGRRDVWNADWSIGESSASQNQSDQNGRKTEHTWTFSSRSALSLEEHQNHPSNNILALDNVSVNSNSNQATNGTFRLQNSSYTLTQDLNMCLGFGNQEDTGDHQGVGQHGMYVSVGSSSEMQSAGCSSSAVGGSSRHGGHVIEDRPGGSLGGSLDSRRLPCKRKAIELNAGQPSEVGSSNCFHNAERSQWHNMPTPQIPAAGINVPTPMENNLVLNNGLEQANPLLRVGIRGAISASPFTLTTPSGNAASSHRNCRLRINGEEIVGNSFPTEADVGNIAGSSTQHGRSGLRNRFIDLNPSPAPAMEIGNLRSPSVQRTPSIRRSHQSRWTGASGTRASTSSSSAIPEEWHAPVYEESTSINIPRTILEHPMFIPASEMGNTSQNPINWNPIGGTNVVAGNTVPVPRVGPSTGIGYSAPGISHRNSRRLSELVRRSLLSSAGTESGSQSNNPDIRSAYPEMAAVPQRPVNHRHRAANSRTLLDRHSAFALPYSLRSLTAASEGRGAIMSEIRHVLDLVRRGEGLRLEDVMLLDHSVFAGMAEIHDRHRDMRLDVDNMSYEELLALEERIGDVCTGLSAEAIMSRLRQHNYVDGNVVPAETEPCSICREEYKVGEDIGTLDCGHDFHRDCIKEWLLVKNLCPICKTTGLAT